MVESRKVIKVFLASPSDLLNERRAAKQVVDEFNANWAGYLGYHVELVGWEDTVSVYGRPQATINRDLERCEYFIGMMWRRWGTPPDSLGKYTSGFEEEFEISKLNREKRGSPEISLYFKEVGDDQLQDPGVELRKVLTFKEKVTAEKTIMFERFGSIDEFQEKIRRCITRYVQSKRSDESLERAEEDQVRSPENSSAQDTASSTPTSDMLLSLEGTQFLQDFASRTEHNAVSDSINAAEVARFRLLGCIIRRNGNDEQTLGVHDSNILFLHRDSIVLGRREWSGLVECGLTHFSSENTPLWFWLSKMSVPHTSWLQVCALLGTTRERVGALASMQLISEPLTVEGPCSKEICLTEWFADEATSDVKVAALKYLAECGSTSDVTVIRAEIERGNYQTRSAAIDAVLRIKLRDSREHALNALFEFQPEAIAATLLDGLFVNGTAIDTEVLFKGLGHKSSAIRREVVRLLRLRKALSVDTVDQLLLDSDAEVRFEALQARVESGRTVSDDEAKAILVKPVAGRGGLGAFGTFDSEGEACWQRFREGRLRNLPNHELAEASRRCSIFDQLALFVFYERNFSKFGDLLRGAVDNHFQSEFSKKVDEMAQAYGPESDLLQKTRQLEDSLRKQLTRTGLEIICRKGGLADLGRVRKLLKEQSLEYSEFDFEFLRKFGEWEDIALIVTLIDRPGKIYRATLLGGIENARYKLAAQAIYTLGRSRFEELLSISMPSRLQSYLVIESSINVFRELQNTSIIELFRSVDDGVRKAAALMCIRALPRARIRQLLEDYTAGDSYRYYNVVHWLDLGVSVPKDRALSAVAKLISAEWPSK